MTTKASERAASERAALRPEGRLIVLSGPAGVGKSTVAERVCRELGLRRSISATTRPRRGDEVDGRDYLFLPEEEFRERVARDEFLEHAQVHEHLYGTPRGPIDEAAARGESRLLVIDVQGAMQVKQRRPDALCIFLDAPDDDTLRRRLEGRASEPPREQQARLHTALIERTYKEHYDHCVTNDDLDRAVAEVCRIIAGGPEPKDRRHALDG